MRDFDFNIPDNARISPQLLVGAASPLWGYFAGAAASGVAFWWMTRWAETVNLEALMAPVAAIEPVTDAPPEPETVIEVAQEMVEGVIEAVAEPVEAAVSEVVETADTVQEAAAEVAAPAPAPRARKVAPTSIAEA